LFIVDKLSNSDILKQEAILDLLATDVLAYLAYLNEKAKAEKIQAKFLEEINKNKRGRR